MSVDPLSLKTADATAQSELGLMLAILLLVLFGVGAIFLVSA